MKIYDNKSLRTRDGMMVGTITIHFADFPEEKVPELFVEFHAFLENIKGIAVKKEVDEPLRKVLQTTRESKDEGKLENPTKTTYPPCVFCESNDTRPAYIRHTKSGTKQVYKCKTCKKKFTAPEDLSKRKIGTPRKVGIRGRGNKRPWIEKEIQVIRDSPDKKTAVLNFRREFPDTIRTDPGITQRWWFEVRKPQLEKEKKEASRIDKPSIESKQEPVIEELDSSSLAQLTSVNEGVCITTGCKVRQIGGGSPAVGPGTVIQVNDNGTYKIQFGFVTKVIPRDWIELIT